MCSDPEIEIHGIYIRFLELKACPAGNNAQNLDPCIYEDIIHSVNRKSNLAEIMPYLVLALFEGFLGKSGEARSFWRD